MEIVFSDARTDWIAFSGAPDFEARGPLPKKRSSSSKRRSSKSSTTSNSSWMHQPVEAAGDPSWVPLVPPGQTPERKKGRQPRPATSPKIALQPISKGSGNSSGRRTSASSHQKAVPSRDIAKPKAARARMNTESTLSTESTSSRENAPRRGRSKEPRQSLSSRGRSQSRGRMTGTMAASPRASTRTPSSPGTSTGKRASSLTPRASESSRERSSSRSRPPVTGHNKQQARARSRSTSRTRVTSPAAGQQRARSTSRTRIMSPVASPAANRHNSTRNIPKHNGTTRKPPPSTYRTRGTLREGGGSNSIGPGIQARSRTMSDDRSTVTADANIGRKIGFVRHKSVSSVSDAGCKAGLREKLFGDQVAPNGPAVKMRPRILLAATVYHNTATNLWITTINTNQRGVAKNPALANKYLKAFSFSTEDEARESAIANAPPKMVPFSESPNCFTCQGKFAMFRRASHCRNCGICVCAPCSTMWSSKMIPDTYNLKNEANVRVCNSCTTLSNEFKKSLLAGDFDNAVALYETGNINLRTPFPVTSKKNEVMHPIHCAVEGGNNDLVRWLIDYHYCPVKLVRSGSNKKAKHSPDVLIQTSKGRSVLSIAIDRLKVDILRYLVVENGISIFEAKDLTTSLRALEASLMALPRTSDSLQQGDTSARWDKTSFDDMSEPSSLGEDENLDDSGFVESKSVVTKGSRSSRGESCIICMDAKINCVATPCGHQVCCLECSSNLAACPVCNNRGEFIRIFRP